MRLLLGAMAVLLVAPEVAAQVQTNPRLELGAVEMSGPVAFAPAKTDLRLPWTLTFPDVAQATASTAGNGTRLDWSGQCAAGVTLFPSSSAVGFEPAASVYTGTSVVQIQASPEAPGVESLPCTFTGQLVTPTATSDHAFPFTVQVPFVGLIEAQATDDRKASGPQKQIPFEIEMANRGNARTQVLWELADAPRGKWNALLPEVTLLDAGQTVSAFFTVATPFQQGYNSDRGTFVIRLVPTAAEDPTQTAEPVELELRASAQGWYIPGPSPVLVFAVMALAAIGVRRLRR